MMERDKREFLQLIDGKLKGKKEKERTFGRDRKRREMQTKHSWVWPRDNHQQELFIRFLWFEIRDFLVFSEKGTWTVENNLELEDKELENMNEEQSNKKSAIQ